MKQFIIFGIFVLTVLTLSACEHDGDKLFGNGGIPSPVDEQSQEGTGDKIVGATFDLPKGWEWMEGEENTGIINEAGRGGNNPLVKIDYSREQPVTKKVTAEKLITENYTFYRDQCERQGESCDGEPNLVEMTIGEKQVFSSMSLGTYWGEPTWTSNIAFEHEGRVVEFWFSDKADLYQEELSTIINSFEFKRE